MNKIIVLAGLAMLSAAPAMAANADHPFQNCDRRNDNCGPRGNAETDRLNGQQLGGSPTVPMAPGGAPMSGGGAPMGSGGTGTRQ